MPEHSVEELARLALLEMTPEQSIGELESTTDEGDGVVTVRFASSLAGYPGWRWTVSIATVEGADPTVLETELMPGDGALLAPDWVPWSDRLAEYKAAQAAASTETEDDDADDDDDDPLGSDVLHGGDLDGVDIDESDDLLDESDDLIDDGDLLHDDVVGEDDDDLDDELDVDLDDEGDDRSY